MELAPDWPLRIRKAREAMGMSQDQFGVRLSEKSSVIHKLESGSIVPSDALVRKIERTLKIRIRSPPEAS
jgi:ribosome-binding protein aMBF1 (putative translation factor)